MDEHRQFEERKSPVASIAITAAVLFALILGGLMLWQRISNPSTNISTTAAPPHLAAPATPAMTPTDANAESTLSTNVAPEDAIVVATRLPWITTMWGDADRVTNLAALIDTGANPMFYVFQPEMRRVWLHRFAVPIDVQNFPLAVFTYRAQNISQSGGTYGIWLDNGTDAWTGGIMAFRSKYLVANGQVQTEYYDLRRATGASKELPPVLGMALGIDAGPDATASIELIDLRFERAKESPAQPPADDGPIHVSVRDSMGNPLENATVTVDFEQKNWSRSAMTDADGMARVTPLANSAGKHALMIELEEFATRYERDVSAGQSIPIILDRTMQLSGRVEDESGSPLAAAVVFIHAGFKQRGGPVVNEATIVTDDQGNFTTPPLPAGVKTWNVRVTHISIARSLDAARDREFMRISQAQLENGRAILVVPQDRPSHVKQPANVEVEP